MARKALAVPIATRRALLERKNKGIYEYISRFETLVTKDVHISVSEFDGEFQISPRSHLLHRFLAHGEYEPDLVKLFLSHIQKDRDIIDVGANIGFFTVLGAKQLTSGRVLAAEPTSAAYQRLKANIKTNNVIDNVITFNGLVSNKNGEDSINIVEGREEYSSMGELIHSSIVGQASKQEKIRASTLDMLVKENSLNPALIKVDVEGAEAYVFEGAEETLKTYRPVVISEFSPHLLKQNGSSAESIISMFNKYNYSVHDPHDTTIKIENSISGDMIAIPN